MNLDTKLSADLEALRRAVQVPAESKTLAEFKLLRDKAEALWHMARAEGLGQEVENLAAEVRLRAERKIGEILKSLNLRGGDHKSNRHHERLKLSDLGITQNQSRRWQQVASVRDDVFEAYIHWATQERKNISLLGLLRFADGSS